MTNSYYRFTNKDDAKSFINNGIIYFNSLSYYKQYDGECDAIKDRDEGKIIINPVNQNDVLLSISDGKTTIISKDNFIIKEISNSLVDFENFFIFCLANKYNMDLYEQFHADTCIEITDINKFKSKISKILPKEFNLYFEDITYYDINDKYQKILDIDKPLIFYKRIKYVEQSESRFYFYCPYKNKKGKANYEIHLSDCNNVQYNVKLCSIRLELGNLSDICNIKNI